jgi:hypothetical protein
MSVHDKYQTYVDEGVRLTEEVQEEIKKIIAFHLPYHSAVEGLITDAYSTNGVLYVYGSVFEDLDMEWAIPLQNLSLFASIKFLEQLEKEFPTPPPQAT